MVSNMNISTTWNITANTSPTTTITTNNATEELQPWTGSME